MSVLKSVRKLGLLIVVAGLGAAGCETDVDGSSGPAVDEVPPQTTTADFSEDGAGSFVQGTSPFTASFDNGVRTGGVWLVQEGTTGVVRFTTPAREVDFTVTRNPELSAAAALFAKAASPFATFRKTTCGVSDQGLDNGEAFGASVFARGGFNDWANPPVPESQFFNFGGNIYQAEFEVVAGDYEYKVATSDWDTYARAADPTPIGSAVTLDIEGEFGGANGTISFAEDGCYNFTLDATDPALPVLTVTEVILDDGSTPPGGGGPVECGVSDQGLDNGEAFGASVFARGGFNDWANPPVPESQFFNFGGNIYQAEFEVVAGDYEYKVATSDWDTYARAADPTPIGSAVTLDIEGEFGGANGTISFAEDGCYNFTLDATDPALPVLTVTKVEGDDGGGGTPGRECGVEDQGLDNGEAFGASVFARGGFNDWANPPVPESQFFNFGDNLYRAEFEVTAGDYEYKVATSDWDTYARAADPTPLDTAVTLDIEGEFGGANGTISFPADGCYTFDLNAADPALPVMTVTEADLGGGGPGPEPQGTDVTILFADGSSEALDTITGDSATPVSVSRSGRQSPVSGIEIAAGDSDVAVENFTWTANPRDVPPSEPVTIFYSRPDGDYTNTVITVDGQDYTCEPTTDSAFGCSVTVDALANSPVQFTVTNSGEPDPTGTFEGGTGGADDNVYAFSGNGQAVTGTLAGTPGPNEVILYYKRDDDAYDGWTVHLFPTGLPGWTNFNPGLCVVEGVDAQLGGFFRITLPPNDCYDANPPALDTFPEELGFIIHRGDEKDPGPDQFIRIAETGNIVFVTSGVDNVGSAPPSTGGISVTGAGAHWSTADTILWNPPAEVSTVELFWSVDASLAPGGEDFTGNFESAVLSAGTNPALPNELDLNSYAAWSLPSDVADRAADLVRGQVVVLGRDAVGLPVAATNVQVQNVLDDLYAEAAKDAVLGPDYSGGSPAVRLWAPTALLDPGVTLNIYASDGSLSDQVAMDYEEASGIWSASGSWDRQFYTFSLQVFSYVTGRIETNEVTDPYSVSLSTNSARSQFVNLADADLKPAGWDGLAKPPLEAAEDVVVYETHIRDFSVSDELVPPADRGKYTAFLTANSEGMSHLGNLAAAGLTHFHALPAFDIATVNEIESERVELDSTVQALCDANPAAAGLCPSSFGSIRELLESLPPESQEQQQVTTWLKDLDGFNWGYDPYHYGVPEGSYASDPEGVTRIVEFRQMVQALSGIGLRTVMDVVYNHTNSSGQNDKSVLDKVVPGYYHRRDRNSGSVLSDSCCPDTTTEFAMMEKLMSDTLATWVSEYKVDAFRFDLMGFHPKAVMERVRDRLTALEPSIYLYGEGWNFGAIANDRRFVQATQANMAGTGIGTFTDRLRDAARGGGPFDSGVAHVRSQGFISGGGYQANAENDASDQAFIDEALLSADQIRVGMAGNLKTFQFEDRTGTVVTGAEVPYGSDPAGYADDPQDIVTYVGKHDNETLWDISQYKHPEGLSNAERIRAHSVGNSIVVLSQSVPFIHAGQDLLRSKSMDRNSFDSGDWFNQLDFALSENNWNKGFPPAQDNQGNYEVLPQLIGDPTIPVDTTALQGTAATFQELLEIRNSSVLFRMRSAEQINSRVTYHNTGPDQVLGLIVQRLDGCEGQGLVPEFGSVVTVVNANNADQTIALFTDETFTLHPVQAASNDTVVQTATHDSNGFFVPARTTAVFVQPPSGEICVANGGFDRDTAFLRGGFNDWADPPTPETAFVKVGTSRVQEVTVAMPADTIQYKVASADWATINCGGEQDVTDPVDVMVDTPATLQCNPNPANLSTSFAAADDYKFALDITDPSAPVLTAKLQIGDEFGTTTAFVRGGFNDWGADDALAAVSPSVLETTVSIAAGDYEFKVAEADWTTINCGGPEETLMPVALTEATTLSCGNNPGNLQLSITDAGDYKFTLDITSTSNPILTVEPQVGAAFDTTQSFIRGGFNDWGTGSPLADPGDGTLQVVVPITAETYEFKVAAEDWATVNCGSVNGTPPVVPGTAAVLSCGANPGNLSIAVGADGDYTFSLDPTNPGNPVLTVTGP